LIVERISRAVSKELMLLKYHEKERGLLAEFAWDSVGFLSVYLFTMFLLSLVLFKQYWD
jgi:hypothetical protein